MNRALRFSASLAALSLLQAAPLAAAPAVVAPAGVATAPTLQRLSHLRQWFTDSQGRVVLLHGGNVNLPGESPRGPSSSPDTAKRMAEQGFNSVRLVVFFSRVMPQPGRIDEAYLDEIAKAVDAYRAAGLYTLIDFHQDQYSATVGVRGMPAWATFSDGFERMPGVQFPMGYFKDPAVQRAFDNFWKNHPVPQTGKGVQDLYADGLAAVARRFADDPAVYGVDVMNEPATGTPCAQPDPAKANCPELEQSLLRPFYQRAGRAISRAAPKTIVLVEPFMLQASLAIPINTPPPSPARLHGLSYHNYAPDPATRVKANDNAMAHAKRVGGAIINTEWGFSNDPGEVVAQAVGFDDQFISWAAWTRGSFEALVDPALPDRGNGNRTAILRAYARPYPSATAGTPERLTFDPAAGVMTLRYVPINPAGKRLSPKALTEIRVPAINYPNGYTVEVTGGQVVSAANAPVLKVRADAGARAVNVRLQRVGDLPPLPPTPAAPLVSLPPIPPGPLSRNSMIGHIQATPGGREVLEKHLAQLMVGLAHVHGVEQMSLASIRELAPQYLTDAKLAAVDADLAKLTVTPGPVAPPTVGLSSRSLVSELLGDPRARGILAREVPGLENAPNRALFPQTTLRNLQPAMPALTDAVLARIDAALARPEN